MFILRLFKRVLIFVNHVMRDTEFILTEKSEKIQITMQF